MVIKLMHVICRNTVVMLQGHVLNYMYLLVYCSGSELCAHNEIITFVGHRLATNVFIVKLLAARGVWG